MVSDDLTIKPAPVTRPDPARLGAGFAWLLVAVVFAIRFTGATRIIVIGIDLVMGGATFWVLTKARRESSISWRNGVDLGWRVEMVGLASGQSAGTFTRMWLLLDPSGRAQLALNPAAWDPSDLDALAATLALQVDVAPKSKRLAQVRKDYPGALPAWAAHPILTGATGVVAIILITVVIAVV
jgi:hypothetical protein